MRVLTLCVVALLQANVFAATQQLATVNVVDAGELRPFKVGEYVASQATGTGPATIWQSIPSILNEGNLSHYHLNPDPNATGPLPYARIDFTVATSGPVWMLTTTRFGAGGNSSGGWLPEVIYQPQLEAAGWKVILEGIKSETGYSPAGQNVIDDFGWLLFERMSTAGETFSIRTEKYLGPVILQGTGVVIPEPATVLLAVMMVLLAACYRGVAYAAG